MPWFLKKNKENKESECYPKMRWFLKSYQYVERKEIKGTYYTGEVDSSGQPHGLGLIEKKDGSFEQGMFKKAKLDRKGIKLLGTTRKLFSGVWSDGKQHGFIKMTTHKDCESFEGEMINNKKHGQGKEVKKGDSYDGMFESNKRHGEGLMKFANGDSYAGNWVEDKMQGFGIFNAASGDNYEGDFQNGKRTGTGTMIYKDGSRYHGEWLNNLYEKQGELEKDGVIYKGQF